MLVDSHCYIHAGTQLLLWSFTELLDHLYAWFAGFVLPAATAYCVMCFHKPTAVHWVEVIACELLKCNNPGRHLQEHLSLLRDIASLYN